MESIKFIRSCFIMIKMIPAPREKKVHFIDFTESMSDDDESSESRRERTIREKTEEKIVRFEILFSKKKNHTLLGILFPNNNIIYHKTKPVGGGAYSKKYNLIFFDKMIYLLKRSRCDYCERLLKRVYRCYDCQPRDGIYKEFCKICHIKREHVGHNVIMLTYNEDVEDPEMQNLLQ